LLERVRGLAGHRLPSGDLMTLIKRGREAYERELTKERFALRRKARGSTGLAHSCVIATRGAFHRIHGKYEFGNEGPPDDPTRTNFG
jgi:hypothetical protein